MKRIFCSLALCAATLGAALASGDTVINVEPDQDGTLVFPKANVGDTLRFRQSCQFANGDITVTTHGGAKLIRQARSETTQGGKLLLTGTKNME